MTKLGSKIFGMTEGIKPRERTEAAPTRIKTTPGMFLDTQHRAAKAEAEIAVLRNRYVRIDELQLVAGRKRQLSTQEFEELKANLEAFPLINPVTIRTLPSGAYELVSGHNRVQAFIELGRTEIEANVIDLAEEQILPAAFYSNLLSPALPDFEKYLGFKQLQLATGKSQADLARESGVSKTMISMLFGFEELGAAAHATLSLHPHLVSATLAAKLKGLPRADEAIARLATGEIVPAQAVAAAAARSVAPAPATRAAPIVIKDGRQRVAQITCRGGTAVVTLVDAAEMPALLKKIEALIRREMVSTSPQKKS